MNTDISKMAFPMVAVTHCTVVKTTHAPDATFDALTEKNATFLHDRGAAKHLRTDAAQAEITAADKADLDASAADELVVPQPKGFISRTRTRGR